jgi:T6SS, Phospholipase effector Tle1-like, catalytic domain
VWAQRSDAGAQPLEQVWFSGAHCNVGGGYYDSGLSDIAFMWMKDRAEECGLAFDHEYIWENISPNVLNELRDARIGDFRLLPPYLRSIRSSNETVDPSALDRMARVAGYAPDNLLAYLQNQRLRQTIDRRYQRAA